MKYIHYVICAWSFFMLNMIPAVSSEIQQTDFVVLFRFVPRRLMFYSPYRGNDEAILQATRLILSHREDIEKGNARIRIKGFCASYPTKRQNLSAAKDRSNQVKSYFITHLRMKEAYYHTTNYAEAYHGGTDVVALVGIEWLDGRSVMSPPRKFPAVKQFAAMIPVSGMPAPASKLPVSELARPVEKIYKETPCALKTNLLYDAILLPSLEAEYHVNPRWSVAVDGSMAWWHNDGKHTYYQLFMAAPEVRYWFKTPRLWHGHYVGMLVGGGLYDLENGGKGYKGRGYMTGVSYGYMFPIGKYFSLETGVAAGFMHTRYEEYVPLDGHYVYQRTAQRNWFGPLKLKLSLVWRIGRWIEKGGNL